MSNSELLLASFDQWKQLTTDQWVLETVQGYRIQFDEFPVQNRIPREIKFSDHEQSLLNNEVEQMLE